MIWSKVLPGSNKLNWKFMDQTYTHISLQTMIENHNLEKSKWWDNINSKIHYYFGHNQLQIKKLKRVKKIRTKV